MKNDPKRSSSQTVKKTSVRDAKKPDQRAPKQKDINKEDDPYIAAVRKALISLHGDVKDGKLLVETVRLRLNETILSGFALERDSNKLLAKMLRYMGLLVEAGTRKKSAVFWDTDIISQRHVS